MRVVRNILVDIHYQKNERKQADKLAKAYERRGFTREDDGDDDLAMLSNAIQLLKTNIKEMKQKDLAQ